MQFEQLKLRLSTLRTPTFNSSDFSFAGFGLKGFGMDIVTFDFVTLSTFHIIQGKRHASHRPNVPLSTSAYSSAATPTYNINYIIL